MSIRNAENNHDELPLIVTREGFAHYRNLAELNEKQARLFCGWLASSIGRGGQQRIADTLGVGINTVRTGRAEFEGMEETSGAGRIRRQGGGRKPVEDEQPGLKEALQKILEENGEACDEPVLHWTVSGLRELQDTLKKEGFLASHVTVGRLLDELGYRKIQNRQMPRPQPRREDQFRFIEKTAADFLSHGDPVISVVCRLDSDEEADPTVPDSVREWLEASHTFNHTIIAHDGQTAFVKKPDYLDDEVFPAEGVNVWCRQIWKQSFPNAKRLLIVCEGIEGICGEGENHWKNQLITLANEMDREITVCFLPSGTMKWRRIEHRLFCCSVSKSDGSARVRVPCIVSTVAIDDPYEKGMDVKVDCEVDIIEYREPRIVSEKAGDIVPLDRYAGWNYTIRLRSPKGPEFERHRYDF